MKVVPDASQNTESASVVIAVNGFVVVGDIVLLSPLVILPTGRQVFISKAKLQQLPTFSTSTAEPFPFSAVFIWLTTDSSCPSEVAVPVNPFTNVTVFPSIDIAFNAST